MSDRIVKITERGWGGHFCLGHQCRFRRNTLLECGDSKIIVSTVGNYVIRNEKLKEIGWNRHYETMIFRAKKEGAYWDADVSEEITAPCEWSLRMTKSNQDHIDNLANQMHDDNVLAIRALLLEGKL